MSNLIKTAEAFLRNSRSKVARAELRHEVKSAQIDQQNDRCHGCGKATKYNGWSNYETWAVALWIDNERGTYEMRREMANEARERGPGRRNEFTSERTTDADLARYLYADRLKEWTESELVPQLDASLASDLLGAALSEVSWDEIASNWLEEE